MRVFFVTLLLLVTFVALPAGADSPEVRNYLDQVRAEIRSQMKGISLKGRAVSSDVDFKTWSSGGGATGIKVLNPGWNAQWDSVAKNTIEKANFPRFNLKDIGHFEITARITYNPLSKAPQPEVTLKSAEPQQDVSGFRMIEMFFYGATYVCAIPCIVMQAIIMIVSFGDVLINKTTRARATAGGRTE